MKRTIAAAVLACTLAVSAGADIELKTLDSRYVFTFAEWMEYFLYHDLKTRFPREFARFHFAPVAVGKRRVEIILVENDPVMRKVLKDDVDLSIRIRCRDWQQRGITVDIADFDIRVLTEKQFYDEYYYNPERRQREVDILMQEEKLLGR